MSHRYYKYAWHCDMCHAMFEQRCEEMREEQEVVEVVVVVQMKGEPDTEYITRLRVYLKGENRRFRDRLRFDQHKIWEWNN